MAGDVYWFGADGFWHAKGRLNVQPGKAPSDPATPPSQVTPRLQITELSLVATGTPGQPAPSPTKRPYFGACPVDGAPGGAAGAQSVLTKWGARAAVRQFFGDFQSMPNSPAGCPVVHSSYRPDATSATQPFTDAQILAGAADDLIAAVIAAARNGDVLEMKHESDNDGLTGQAALDRIQVKNRFYDIKQVTKPGVLVAHTHTGGMWASYGNDATRDLNMTNARGDLIGLDADGIHTTTGPVYVTDYSDEVANVKRYLTKFKSGGWQGWSVPEHGTSRQPWDPTGTPRAQWFAKNTQYFVDNGAYYVCLFDFNTTAHNTATDYNRVLAGTPEYDTWRNLVASNPAN